MDINERTKWIEAATSPMANAEDKKIAAIQMGILMNQIDIAVEGLQWLAECKAEAVFDPEGEKWKAEVMNKLCVEPMNRKAQETLDRMKPPPLSL